MTHDQLASDAVELLQVLANDLRRKRDKGKLSIRQAAKQIGIGHATLSRIESRKLPDIRTFGRCCTWLGVSADNYLTDTRTPPPSTVHNDGWFDISTAPKDGSLVLVFARIATARPNSNPIIACARWDYDFDREWNDDTDEQAHIGAWTDDTVASWGYEERTKLEPTHWMPLPSPPSPPAAPAMSDVHNDTVERRVEAIRGVLERLPTNMSWSDRVFSELIIAADPLTSSHAKTVALLAEAKRLFGDTRHELVELEGRVSAVLLLDEIDALLSRIEGVAK